MAVDEQTLSTVFSVALASLEDEPPAPVPEWRELHPETPPRSPEEAQRLIDGASYIASRGLESFNQLKTWIHLAEGQPWIKHIQVQGAVANNHSVVVKYLLDEVGVDINCLDSRNGCTPLHYACIWGRPGLAVLLLSRGADMSITTPKDETALRIAVARLEKLKRVRDSYDNIEEMRREGQMLVDILQGVTGEGYAAWARRQINNHFVQKHSPRLISAAQRLELVVMRALVHTGRAAVLTCEEQTARELERLRAARPVKSLDEAMQDAGLANKTMQRQVKKLLEVQTVEELVVVTREDVAELDELSSAERRTLWQFISAQKAEFDAVSAGQESPKTTATGRGGGATSIGTSKKASKKKGGSNGKAKKSPTSYRGHWDANSAIAFVFRPDLPMDAFTVVAKLLYSYSS
uniref:Uncharacterized protein n=1 Tax=Rhizochromulina marina TaxID=1034831 RepID=A0A7S2SRH5_9STRA|mmetsp:Transcript_5393/g.15861  ORF Transcript_5393/g.15861 Transcript_5393/m.15861 type:complete len:407 (+) Transcript_5393:86-1306(+)